jgi:hypothetical protein
MNDNTKLIITGLVAVVLSVFIANYGQPLLGGDFAGGIVPSQLFSANTATQSITPLNGVPNLLLNGNISVGGVSANNQVTDVYTAVETYPWTQSSTSAIVIASGTTNTTSTSFAFNAPGFAVGDPCEVQYSGTTSTLYTQGFVSAVNGSAVTTTVTFLNSTLASITMTVTSTVTGVTSTVKSTCIATGV